MITTATGAGDAPHTVLLRVALADYITDLRLEGKTQATIRTYRPTIRAFIDWLEVSQPTESNCAAHSPERESGGGSAGDSPARFSHSLSAHTANATAASFTLPTLRRYRLTFTRSRPRTIKRIFNALHCFGAWLLKGGHITENPVREVPLPKLDPAKRPRVSEMEISLLLGAIPQIPAADRALHGAVLSILCETGVRRQELLDLRVEDIDLAEHRLTVACGKGGKARVVYMPQTTVARMAAWLTARSALLTPCRGERRSVDPGWLWLIDRRPRRLGQEALSRLLLDALDIAGLGGHDNIRPHALRHAFATRLHRANADLTTIQAVLGHSHITTTALYLHTDEVRLKEVAELAHVDALEKVQPAAPAPEKPTLRTTARFAREDLDKKRAKEHGQTAAAGDGRKPGGGR